MTAQPTSDPVAAACKRCKGETTTDKVYSYGRSAGYRVFCEYCANHGPLSQTQTAAVRAWNTEQAA